MKAYISGPMTGRLRKNELAFNIAEKIVVDRGASFVVNPISKATEEQIMGQATRDEYLGFMKEDVFDLLFDVWWFPRWLKLLLIEHGGLDTIILLPGWPKSKGAKFELAIAKFFGFTVGRLTNTELRRAFMKEYDKEIAK